MKVIFVEIGGLSKEEAEKKMREEIMNHKDSASYLFFSKIFGKPILDPKLFDFPPSGIFYVETRHLDPFAAEEYIKRLRSVYKKFNAGKPFNIMGNKEMHDIISRMNKEENNEN